jgi:DnaK suppressor protein
MPKVTQIKTMPLQSLHRFDTLKRGLLERQHELRNHVHNRMRDGRARRAQEGTDDLEHSESDIQDDLALALLQIQSETLVGIDAALARLDEDAYGLCVECEREIATRRLRALPFAVRCQVCEKTREESQGDAHRLAQGRGSLGRFSEIARV